MIFYIFWLFSIIIAARANKNFKDVFELEDMFNTWLVTPIHVVKRDISDMVLEYNRRVVISFDIKQVATFDFISVKNPMKEGQIKINADGTETSHLIDVLNELGEHSLIIKIKDIKKLRDFDRFLLHLKVSKLEIYAVTIDSEVCRALACLRLNSLRVCVDIIFFDDLETILLTDCQSIELNSHQISQLPSKNTILRCKASRLIIRCPQLDGGNADDTVVILISFYLERSCLDKTVIPENIDGVYNKSDRLFLDQTKIQKDEFIFRCPQKFQFRIMDDIVVDQLSICTHGDMLSEPFYKIRVRESMTLCFNRFYDFQKFISLKSTLKVLRFELQNPTCYYTFLEIFELLSKLEKLTSIYIKICPNEPCGVFRNSDYHNRSKLHLPYLNEIFLESDDFIPIFFQNSVIAETLEICNLRTKKTPLPEILPYFIHFKNLRVLDIREV